MASVQALTCISLPRAASFVGDYGKVVTLDANGRAAIVTAVTEIPIGVIAEELTAAVTGVGRDVPPVGSPVSIAVLNGSGIVKVKAGADITRGHFVVLDTTDGTVAGVANVAAATDDQLILGRALDAAEDGDLFRMIAQPLLP